MRKIIEQDTETGFTYSKVYTGRKQHHRIESDPQGYAKAKRNAKKDTAWQAVVNWYEGNEKRLSGHEKQVQKKFTALLGKATPDGSKYQYRDIAEVAGCSATTVSKVMNGHNQLSKELADEILNNLNNMENSNE